MDLSRIVQPDADWKRLDKAPGNLEPPGRYDGAYAVYKDGGVGYIRVQTLPDERKNRADPDPCGTYRFAAATCATEKLPHGDDVLAFVDSEHAVPGDKWGPELTVEQYKSGYMVLVTAGSGYEGKGGLGPRLDSPPLTKDQLRELVQLPQLLPKGKVPKD